MSLLVSVLMSMPYHMCAIKVNHLVICNVSLDPAMRSISSSNLRNCFGHPTAIVPMRPFHAFVLVCSMKMLKRDGDKMRLWRTLTVV